MTQPPQPTERFAQHARLAELVTALGFRRYRLFLAGLLYREPGGPLRRVTAVASRDGDLVAYDAGEVAIELLHHRFLPQGPAPLAITGSEVLGVVPLEVTDALLDEFRRLAGHHERGFMAEQVLEVLARGSSWSVHQVRTMEGS
jgi:hypothetical protein